MAKAMNRKVAEQGDTPAVKGDESVDLTPLLLPEVGGANSCHNPRTVTEEEKGSRLIALLLKETEEMKRGIGRIVLGGKNEAVRQKVLTVSDLNVL
jgi:hypothetical protein